MDHTTDRQTPHRVFFDAAAAAYEDGSPPPKGYRPVKRFEHGRSGFKAVVYENGAGERIYAIAGTEGVRDVVADLTLGEEQFRNRPFGKMIEDAPAWRMLVRILDGRLSMLKYSPFYAHSRQYTDFGSGICNFVTCPALTVSWPTRMWPPPPSPSTVTGS